MSRKHIATYPLFGQFTGARVGTGYIYTVDQIEKVRTRLAAQGQSLSLRWRNKECRQAATKINSRQLGTRSAER
jgi:hypothetical protein